MDLHDFSDMGNQIKDIVQDAVDSMNFDSLSRDITRTINDTFKTKDNKGFYYTPRDEQGHEIHSDGQPGASEYTNYQTGSTKRRTSYTNYRKPGTSSYTYDNSQNCQNGNARPYQSSNTTKPAKKASVYDVGFPVTKNPPGSVLGTALMSVGISLSVLCGVAELAFGGCALLIPGMREDFLMRMFAVAPVLVASLGLSVYGNGLRGRVNRFKAYLGALKGKTFASFKELSGVVGKSEKYVCKDVTHMIEDHFFLEGHVDEQKTCLMVNNDIYQQYLLAQESLKERSQNAANAKTDAQTQAQMDEFQKIIAEGKRYMTRIREANDAIPDTEISNKLYRMELIVGKIFDYVAKHPEQIGQLRRFMDYYMPTTDKLVNAYKDFDMQPIQGENIKKAKTEIAATLDTINEAYEKLYDSMYAEAVMDVSSDIVVLQTLLAQEGLTGSAFDKQEEHK